MSRPRASGSGRRACCAGDRRGGYLAFASAASFSRYVFIISSCSLLRHDGVLGELHRELALALRRRAEVGRVAEHRVQRDFGT